MHFYFTCIVLIYTLYALYAFPLYMHCMHFYFKCIVHISTLYALYAFPLYKHFYFFHGKFILQTRLTNSVWKHFSFSSFGCVIYKILSLFLPLNDGHVDMTHRPIQYKDLVLPVNGTGSGVPTDVIFIYSICFKHFLIDLGC